MIPEYFIAIVVYLIGSVFFLWGWSYLSRPLPRIFRLTIGIILFAILLTPTISEGVNAALAPAVFGLLFGILTKESSLVWVNLSSICIVIALGFLMIFCWNYYIEDRIKKEQAKLEE